jgi:isoleucyl-tRNA synthetase
VQQVKDPAKGTVYIVAEARLTALPGAVPKAKKGGDKKKGKEGEAAAPVPAGFELLAKFQGAELVSGFLYLLDCMCLCIMPCILIC